MLRTLDKEIVKGSICIENKVLNNVSELNTYLTNELHGFRGGIEDELAMFNLV
ncbi:MAG: hypothetical protein GQ574_28550 [Crocinitomix sp.]|nr:hypothetical protein [Crocinitomix sp.]